MSGNNEIRTHILKARCIDGTIYYGYGGWTSNIYDAEWMTPQQAELHLSVEVGMNKKRELDDQKGRFEILPIPEHVFVRRQVVEYLVEGNSKEDLAHQLCEALCAGDYQALVIEMKESMFHQEQEKAKGE